MHILPDSSFQDKTKLLDKNANNSISSLHSGNRDWLKPFLTWSLKSGGRWVGFDKRLHLEAFAYLSAQHNCVDITERPILDTQFSESACKLISIATRDTSGKERLYAIQDCNEPDQESWERQWRKVESEISAKGLKCSVIHSSDLSQHHGLIQNWLQMMGPVRTAELDPDYEIQAEIRKYAAHPQGVSIRTVLEHIDSPKPNYVVAQAYWLLHEQELTADISTSPLTGKLVLHRKRRH